MRAILLPGPRQVELVDVPEPQLGPEDVLVEVRVGEHADAGADVVRIAVETEEQTVATARAVKAAGADLLDINAGMPGIDEKQTLLDIISTVVPVVNLPLVIDSSDPDVVEAAVRYYPGRALINSISSNAM